MIRCTGLDVGALLAKRAINRLTRQASENRTRTDVIAVVGTGCNAIQKKAVNHAPVKKEMDLMNSSRRSPTRRREKNNPGITRASIQKPTGAHANP
jgi:hypothetical protein